MGRRARATENRQVFAPTTPSRDRQLPFGWSKAKGKGEAPSETAVFAPRRAAKRLRELFGERPTGERAEAPEAAKRGEKMDRKTLLHRRQEDCPQKGAQPKPTDAKDAPAF